MSDIFTTLYRALPADKEPQGIEYPRRTVRAPQNIPYLVDNLWEWLRPYDYPSRRHAVYASPAPRLALQSASSSPGTHYYPYHVILHEPCRIACLAGYRDARDHPDVRRLPRVLLQALGCDWPALPLAHKQSLAALFLPCISRSELDQLLTQPEWTELAHTLRQASHYWSDVELIGPLDQIEGEAECFFEPPAAGYRLQYLSEEEETALWLDHFPDRDPANAVMPQGLIELLDEAERRGELQEQTVTLEQLQQELAMPDPQQEQRQALLNRLGVEWLGDSEE